MTKIIFRTLIGVLLLSIPSLAYCQKLPVLQLEEAYKKQEPINSNEFIGSINYIPLETTPECLIGTNPKVNLTEKYILIRDTQNQCFLFDRFTGKFIRSIGHYGRDPGGFRSNRGFFNEITSTIFFTGWKGDLLKYSLDGKYLGAILIPNYNEDMTGSYTPDRIEYLDGSHIVTNIINTNGLLKTLLLIFDENGKEVKTIPNRKPLIQHKFSLSTGDVKFYHYNQNLYFNEFSNDTVFKVSLKNAEPYMIMYRGKLLPTRDTRFTVNGLIETSSFFESDNFLLIDIWVRGSNNNLALYNKGTSKLKVCDIETGFKNNSDGFVPFLPVSIYNDELISIINQQDIARWVAKNNTLKDKLPVELKALTQKNPTDNPTIAIAKLK